MEQSQAANEEMKQLVARVNSGDEHAFEELLRLYYADLVRFAEYLLQEPEAAEDIVCEVFARLWTAHKNWKPRTTIIAYLVAAVRNQAITARRTERRRSGMSGRVADESDSWMGGGHGGVGDQNGARLESAEQVAKLHRMLNDLSETAREAVVLRWIHELSFEEIAEVLGTTPAAVQMQISRALRRLRGG